MNGILEAIGNTSLIRLENVVPPGAGKVFVKAEWENPTGSMKDRMALGVIRQAERSGRLKRGGTVVEYTGGSTGASVALVCRALGYHLRIVTSDAFSPEKRDQMKALGAHLTLIESEGGLFDRTLFLRMIDCARQMSSEPNTFWVNQLENRDAMVGYHALGDEIWQQTDGKVDAFVHSVGTSASIQGVAHVLTKKNPRVRLIAVEPAESAVLAGGPTGKHQVEGIGIGYLPPMWDSSLPDEIYSVTTAEAKEMARRLARDEGIFAGTSTGLNAVAAIRAAESLGSLATVVTLAVDHGLKYLSTDVYRSSGAEVRG